MKKKPLILITNDDGIVAPGIKALVEAARPHGEIVVVAPDSPQSAKGHAITTHKPIRLNKVDVFEGVDAYECSGTPVDCVKLGKYRVLRNRKIDLCISGINHGSNASINILYSGTLSAAMEASIDGINSIGFSLLDFNYDADFSAAEKIASDIIAYVLEHGMKETNLLNVNIPKLPYEEIKGIKVCAQAEGVWQEDFQVGLDPRGREYYWLIGKFEYEKSQKNTDLQALDEGYVSVVPSAHDLTNYKAIEPNSGIEKIM